MAVVFPSFVAAGAASATTGSAITPGYPTAAQGVQAGDLFVMHCVGQGRTTNVPTVTTPAGWTALYAADGTTNQVKQWVLARTAKATGSDSGTVSVTVATPGTNGVVAGTIYAVRGVVAANFVEDPDITNGLSTTVAAPPVTAGDTRLCCAFVGIGGNQVPASFSGETGGNWVVATSTSGATGDGYGIQLQTAQVSKATITGGTATITSDNWVVRAFSLKSFYAVTATSLASGAPTLSQPQLGRQYLPPMAIVAATNLTGAVTAIDEFPWAAGSDWITATSATAATDLRVSFALGQGPSAGKAIVFNEDFIDLSGVDLSDTRAGGFNFYPKQWFGGGATPTASIIQQAPSVVRLGQRPGTNYYNNRGRIQTASTTSEGSYFGNAWGGGAYFEVRMKWSQQDISGTQSVGQYGIYLWPVEYLEDLDHNATSQWPGQASGFGHFAELDLFEFAGTGVDGTTYAGRDRYQTTQHDWAGVTSSYSHFYNANTPTGLGYTPDWTAFHTYGALWTPQTSTTVPGSIKFYFDGAHIVGADVYWKNPDYPSSVAWPGSWPTTPQDRSTAALADAKFAVIDAAHLALGLDGHTECGMDVDWVRVWR